MSLFGTIEIRLNRLRGMDDRMRRQASRVVKSYALQGEAMVKVSMGEPKHGRIYERPGGKSHQASAPGESPAIDIGNLVGSVQAEGESDATWVINAGAEYAIYLEYGTTHMAPRPFMEPMAEALRGPFLRDLGSIVERSA